MVRWLGGGLAVVLLALGAAAIYLLGTYADAPVDPDWAIPGSTDIPPGAITVRWTGTSTLVFSDGEDHLIVDGWFSRPGPLSLYFGEIEPDVAAIARGLERNGVTRASAVIPVHSHFDHAMDAPEVAKRTGAVLLGSESTANIGRGWGLPEEQIRVVQDGLEVWRDFGSFEVVVMKTKHFEFPDPAVREMALGDPHISEPLVPPVGTFEYKVGEPYALYLVHERGKILVQGSAGYIEGAFEKYPADIVFLGVGGLGTQTPEYREAYWRETVGLTRPTRIVPVHWDGLTGPIEGPFRGEVRVASFLSGGTDLTLDFLKAKEKAHPEIQFMTLPRYDPVVLF